MYASILPTKPPVCVPSRPLQSILRNMQGKMIRNYNECNVPRVFSGNHNQIAFPVLATPEGDILLAIGFRVIGYVRFRGFRV